jgi:ABC-type transporter MlaC component
MKNCVNSTIIQKSVTPDGIPIQLEDRSGGLGGDIRIAAYPTAECFMSGIQMGQTYRLEFSESLGSRSMKVLFGMLKSGEIVLNDLSVWFRKGAKVQA